MLLGLGRQTVQAKLWFKIKRFWIPVLRATHQFCIIDFWPLQLADRERLPSKKLFEKYYNKMNMYMAVT